ncbi:MAG: chromosome segregation protein SMC [Clostridia bacterium]|nr:chromosome segregation protein SMC [Clostridia bacterium]
MYLKKLELHGFKSFADKTILEFMPGITAVIGPNGSGKSNISDSIRWVLGEQSMKSLRGTKSEDIIFAGTQNRKSLGFAEASIVIDNSDGKLPIDYREVTVTRRIYRSGESGYYINKAPCRLKDVQELFMDTGIGKDGYSIIGQGRIDEILSNKSEDRRHIFEEAAGIVKYRVRKVESEKKLEQTKLNLLRITDILTEIEGTIEPLRIQSDKAKKFLDLREELKGIEIGLFLHNIDNYKEKIAEIVKDVDILSEQENGEETKLEEQKNKKEELKLELENIIQEVERLQNIGFETSNKIEKINSDINVTKQKTESNIENIERYKKEIEELAEKIKNLQEEKEQKLSKKTSLFADKEKFEKELKEKEEELAKLTSTLSSKELEMEEKKKILNKNVDTKYELLAQINTYDANYDNLKKSEKTCEEEQRSCISELDAQRLEKEEIAKRFQEIEADRNKINKELEEYDKQKEESEARKKEYDTKINNLEMDLRVKESKLKFLIETEREKEGYSKSIKSILKASENDANLKKGMHDVLANIISVPNEYQTAIEMALGQAMQNIVTDTEETAKKLVEYLRKNNLGRASFLPITSVKGKKIEKVNSKNIGGVIGIASDLVKYDAIYEKIILNLLGRTIIVDDMDSAIALAKQNSYTFRIVTLNGDIINPSGAITGGSVTTKTANILGRKKEIEELEKEVKKLSKELEKVQNDKKEYLASIQDVLAKLQELEQIRQEKEIIYATEKQKVTSIENNVLKLENRLAKLKEDKQNIIVEKEENRKQKVTTEEEIVKLEEEVATLNTIIEDFAKQNKDNQKYIDDLNFDITNLKISVSSFNESEASIDEIVERVNLDIENSSKSIENKKKICEDLKLENQKNDDQIVIFMQDIENAKLEVSSSSDKIAELKESRANKNDELSKIEEDINSKLELIDNLKEQISKIEIKKSKLEVELEQVINKMWEDYEITPNNAENYSKPENVTEVQKRVTKLREQIKALGSINIDSIEEYKKTKERFDFMQEQKKDLEQSSEKLKKVISEMTEVMKKQFAEQFKIINKNFGEIFAELFGGGKANLKLADEDNVLESGIDIEAQPPGKKLQNMMLLSGGEKALTAIALLFAILKINPAPFCVLDEIEAALDDVNVYRFAEYLKKFTKQIQFLVITHRKGTMEAADTVYGITMEENGISKLLSMKLN